MPKSSTSRTPCQTRSRSEATPARPTADKSTNTAKTKAPARNMTNFDQLAQVIAQFVNCVHEDRMVATLSDKFCTAPVPAHLYESLEAEIQTDASLFGLSSVLSQNSGNSLRPVAFICRRLT